MIKRISSKETEKYNLLLSSEEIEGLRKNREVGFADVRNDGEVCGVVTLSKGEEKEKNILIMEEYFVRPEYRRQGRFRAILEYLRTNLSGGENPVDGIISQVILPDMAEHEAAFLACGFDRIADGCKVIEFPASDLKGSVFTKKSVLVKQKLLKRFSDLSGDEIHRFKEAFSDGIFPNYLGPQNLGDGFLLDHSFVFHDGEGACSGFLLSSAVSDHTLYLGSMYVAEGFSPMAIVMLSALYSKIISGGRFTQIMCALATPDSTTLARHILENHKGDITTRITHNYYLAL